ncbi:hypothetical protein ACVIIV_006546 [Bradyrhizobium sp. USDA 4354]
MKSRRIHLEMFLPRLDWVLSGSVTGWGEELVSYFDLVAFVTTPHDIRLKRPCPVVRVDGSRPLADLVEQLCSETERLPG